jgi:hypothetical protein
MFGKYKFSLIPRSQLSKRGKITQNSPFLRELVPYVGFSELYPYIKASYAYRLQTGEGTGVDLGEYPITCYITRHFPNSS